MPYHFNHVFKGKFSNVGFVWQNEIYRCIKTYGESLEVEYKCANVKKWQVE